MRTEDTPKPAAWLMVNTANPLLTPSVTLTPQTGWHGTWEARPLYDQATIDVSVAAANSRWECALGAVMPADFKCWHQNEKSELPEIAAGVIENLRQKEADAWEQLAAAVAKDACVIKSPRMLRNELLRLRARVVELEATEEGAKVAFGHVVEQKQAAERECMRVQGLLAAAYADIRRAAQRA